MTPVFQAPHSKLCGQAVAASILDFQLDKCVRLMGGGPTSIERLRKFLAAYGVTVGRNQRLTKKMRTIARRAIVRQIEINGTRGHWILMWDGVLHDPEPSPPPDGWKITSFYELANAREGIRFWGIE